MVNKSLLFPVKKLSERIIGGYNSSARPFYVRLEVDAPREAPNVFFGGVIIHENYVLTAAHIYDKG